MFSIFRHFAATIVLCMVLAGSNVILAGDNDWRPVTPAELQMKTGKVESDANAEAIFWEVRIDDVSQDLIMKHYIRVKIFNEQGREKYSKVDIPYLKGVKIKNIMARVIKADGSITELAKADIFDREILKADKIKVKAKSFAVPNIEPGAILEYRYQEFYPHGSASSRRLIFQHDIPIQNISYYMKPGNDMRILPFNMDETKFIEDKGGYYKAAMQNVPSIKVEEYMPPEDEVRSWMLPYYADLKEDSMDFWGRAGYYISKAFDIKDTLKPGKEIKAAAASIVGGATAPDDQMAKLYEFCKTKVKNITFDTTMTDEQKDEIKPSKSVLDTYKKMQGTDDDINELFASLATALGHEARLAFGGDRSEKFFNPRQSHASFIHFSSVAVKIGGRWKYYDPGDQFAPYGMLPWNEEDTSVLLLSSKDYVTTKTPLSDPEASGAKRNGKFKLLEDGTLEGTVNVEYSGQLSYMEKKDGYRASANKREEDLKEAVKKRMSTAEITDIRIDNATDPDKPYGYSYKVRIPNYAQKAGKRIFFQPGYFEYGKAAEFSSATRKYDVYFHYPWSEKDSIEFTLPSGYVLDSPDSPPAIADGQKIAALNIDIRASDANSYMKYDRNFFFGGNGTYLFPASSYQAVKAYFDAFQKANSHSITLRQK